MEGDLVTETYHLGYPRIRPELGPLHPSFGQATPHLEVILSWQQGRNRVLGGREHLEHGRGHERTVEVPPAA